METTVYRTHSSNDSSSNDILSNDISLNDCSSNYTFFETTVHQILLNPIPAF